MNATAEIDGAGRLVVPKKLRDALHLVAGTRLTLRQDGDSIVIQPEVKPRGLYMKKGMLVYDSGASSSFDAVKLIEEDREARIQHLIDLAGPSSPKKKKRR